MSEPYAISGSGLPTLDAPVMVVMLTGWIDASASAAAAMAAIELESDATTIVTFDGDTFIDYRARRPTMELRDGVNTRLAWPDIDIKAGHDLDGNDVLLLTGPEPDMAWRRFGTEVAALASRLGVRRMVALGAYPFATPHTRPSRLSLSTPSSTIAASLPLLKNSVDVPAGVAAVLEHACHDAGIEALGIWVQVPHYISSMAYPAATLALLTGLGEVAGIRISGAAARRETVIQRQRLDELVAGNDEHRNMVAQLEALFDAADEATNAAGPGPMSAADFPSADELAAEFEQFLRDQNGN
jgi:hypothetical protein